MLRALYSAYHTPFHLGIQTSPGNLLRSLQDADVEPRKELPQSAGPSLCPSGHHLGSVRRRSRQEKEAKQVSSWEQQCPGHQSESRETHQAGPSLAVREETEAQGGERLSRVMYQGSTQDGHWSPGCLCQPTLLCTGSTSWPKAGGTWGLSGDRGSGLSPSLLSPAWA